jgi:hypothetical protein
MTATRSHLKATPVRVDSQGIGTLKPTSSHPKATLKPPQCDPKATPKPRQGECRTQNAECRMCCQNLRACRPVGAGCGFSQRGCRSAGKCPRLAIRSRPSSSTAPSSWTPSSTCFPPLRGSRQVRLPASAQAVPISALPPEREPSLARSIHARSLEAHLFSPRVSELPPRCEPGTAHAPPPSSGFVLWWQ